MKENYQKPCIEVVLFEKSDVITVSWDGPDIDAGFFD